jgi:hypothetical protein
MVAMQTINRRKLWLLASLTWCMGIPMFSYENIARSYRSAINELYTTQRNEAARQFDFCLSKNGKAKWEYISKYGDECKNEALKDCSGIWCILNDSYDNIQVRRCIFKQVAECVPQLNALDVASYGGNPQSINLKVLFNTDAFRKAIFLIMLFPLLLSIAPYTGRQLLKWLKT